MSKMITRFRGKHDDVIPQGMKPADAAGDAKVKDDEEDDAEPLDWWSHGRYRLIKPDPRDGILVYYSYDSYGTHSRPLSPPAVRVHPTRGGIRSFVKFGMVGDVSV